MHNGKQGGFVSPRSNVTDVRDFPWWSVAEQPHADIIDSRMKSFPRTSTSAEKRRYSV